MKIISVVVGIIILTLTVITNIPLIDVSISDNKSNAIIGKKVEIDNLWSINKPRSLYNNKNSDFVIMLISPTCPHCRHALKLLENKTGITSITVIPVFKKKASSALIKEMLIQEGIKKNVYRLNKETILDSIRMVPAFIYVKNRKLKNIITGGTSDEKEFNFLIKSLLSDKSEKWKKNELYSPQSACSL